MLIYKKNKKDNCGLSFLSAFCECMILSEFFIEGERKNFKMSKDSSYSLKNVVKSTFCSIRMPLALSPLWALCLYLKWKKGVEMWSISEQKGAIL